MGLATVGVLPQRPVRVDGDLTLCVIGISLAVIGGPRVACAWYTASLGAVMIFATYEHYTWLTS